MIILKNRYNKTKMSFFDKETLINFINQNITLDGEDVELHAKANNLPVNNLKRWPINEIISLFMADFERIYKKEIKRHE